MIRVFIVLGLVGQLARTQNCQAGINASVAIEQIWPDVPARSVALFALPRQSRQRNDFSGAADRRWNITDRSLNQNLVNVVKSQLPPSCRFTACLHAKCGFLVGGAEHQGHDACNVRCGHGRARHCHVRIIALVGCRQHSNAYKNVKIIKIKRRCLELKCRAFDDQTWRCYCRQPFWQTDQDRGC